MTELKEENLPSGIKKRFAGIIEKRNTAKRAVEMASVENAALLAGFGIFDPPETGETTLSMMFVISDLQE
jgi:hypothetical protein